MFRPFQRSLVRLRYSRTLRTKWGGLRNKFFSWEYVVLSVLLVGLFFFFTGKNGILALIRLSSEKQRITRELVELKASQQEIQRRINSLKNNPYEEEKIAREQLGMAKPDEYIYRFIQDPKAKH